MFKFPGLVIHQQQMETLAERAQRDFADRTAAHLRRVWPERCTDLGTEGVQKSIQKGFGQARKYGIQSEYDITRFTDLMYLFSVDFDTAAPVGCRNPQPP